MSTFSFTFKIIIKTFVFATIVVVVKMFAFYLFFTYKF